MAHDLIADDERQRLEALIDAWLDGEVDPDGTIVAVVKETEPASTDVRWYVRIHGEQKDVYTVWLTLSQRALHYETYLMPAPEENEALLYEHLLRRNRKLLGIALAIGIEDAIFLVGETPVEMVDDAELDRVIGTVFDAVELCFRPAMRIGYASKFMG